MRLIIGVQNLAGRAESESFWYHGDKNKTGKISWRKPVDEVEWDMLHNLDADNLEGRDSIWIGWKKSSWSCQLLAKHKQFIHARMSNSGGYNIDITVVYREWDSTHHRTLWDSLQVMAQISDNRDWLTADDFNKIKRPEERDGIGQFDHVAWYTSHLCTGNVWCTAHITVRRI